MVQSRGVGELKRHELQFTVWGPFPHIWWGDLLRKQDEKYEQ